jgi:putative heme iron utilization protein
MNGNAAGEAFDARRIMRARRHGTLSTLSLRLKGYPFGSAVPFVMDHAARPVLLVSALAEHTKNIAADPRASLLVHEPPGEDIQAQPRVTVVGDVVALASTEPVDVLASIRRRYVRYQPDAAGLLELGDFAFYRIEPVIVRFIGGFGRIHWIQAATYRPGANDLALAEPSILDHMNEDHAPNLVDYCRHVHRCTPAAVRMIGIDCDGFDVRADDRLLRFEFPAPVADAEGVRGELVRLAKAARRT